MPSTPIGKARWGELLGFICMHWEDLISLLHQWVLGRDVGARLSGAQCGGFKAETLLRAPLLLFLVDSKDLSGERRGQMQARAMETIRGIEKKWDLKIK